MSDNENSVRRFNRQNCKDRLDPVSPEFPSGEAEPLSDPLSDEETPDFMAFLSDDSPDEGLELLASLPPRVLRPNAITPAEERFPPLAPPPPAPKPRKTPTRAAVKVIPPPRRNRFYNALTLIAFLAIAGWLVVFGVIWTQPQSWLNPFPPAPEFVYVTATPGSATAPTLVATIPAAPIVVDAAGYPFVMTDAVLYAPNGNGLACQWGSIAGSISARDGSPLEGYRISVKGNGLDEVAFSGAALTFGPGGYEMPLGSVPQTQDYTVQLLSPQGAPLSPIYPVTTQALCEQNVAIVNFHQAP